jgi:hypothetical protein
MDFKYLCYSGSALQPVFALFPNVVSHKEVHALISQMIDKEETNWEVRTAGSLSWNGLDGYKTADFGNDLDPQKNSDDNPVVTEPGENDAELMFGYFENFKRARFIKLGEHFVVLNRWPLEEKILRIDFLESLQILGGTVTIELEQDGGEMLFTIKDINIEADSSDEMALGDDAIAHGVKYILNTLVDE